MVRIVSSEDPEIPFRRRSVPNVQLFLYVSAAEAMTEAADADAVRDRETMGLVVGKVYRDDQGLYAVADRVLFSELLAERDGVRFDRGSMDLLIEGIDSMDGDERVIGWFHSHLGCGCFMSDTDVRSQHSVFGKGMGFAIVIDPLRAEFAVFDNSEIPEKVQIVMVE